MKPKTYTLFRLPLPATSRIAWWLASAALVLLASRHLPDHLWNSYAHVDLGYVGVALLSVGGNTLAKALRWRRLLAAAGHTIALTQLLQAVIIGQMLNWIAPARVGDVGRAYLLGDDAPAPMLTLATVGVEKLLDVIAYAFVALVVVIWVPLPGWLGTSLRSLIGAGMVVGGGILLVLRARIQVGWTLLRLAHFMPIDRWERLVTRLQTGFQGFAALAHHNDQNVLIGWSAVIWLTAILNNVLVMLAVGLHLPWPAALLLLVGLQAGIALPGLPGTVGVFEYACVAILALWSVQQSVALSYAVLLHGVVMLPPVVVGAVLWGRMLQNNVRNGVEQDARARLSSPSSAVELLGVRVDCLDTASMLERVGTWCEQRRSRTIAYANAHCLNLAATHPDYRAILKRTDLVYSDGIGVVLAARLLGGVTLHKATGADWIDQFCGLAATKGWRIFILAGRPGIAERACAVLQERYPSLQLVGTCDGFFHSKSETAVIDELGKTQPHVLFVGMGTPHQEQWIDHHHGALPHTVCWPVGALFDYVAEVEPRAPRWMRATGLEWAWRLLVDPRGKWRRYVLGNPLFVYRVLCQKWRQH
ncbi:MAG: flippase-like domain-containing protein [Herpetosiphonaceae bacterium]|nr:flippase-like domain-containing protein [Herpetosiphonaceae bacterium]